ncbi:NUDIX domain-containing protein [[Mycobacterium] wendilense]|uniref:NUDIX domain-containing protein n=1 Tax=[Mycobacterium] wendilense TaxID=3064284 RepID=A0ABM9M8A4_9MYCO|nr:NUDIX domain-containing protein [Mycolicibacterium sp. MU0050]CAJ1578793.1 NUDIX domain-containing protein [Mycolicibacterium sp. MU0050]
MARLSAGVLLYRFAVGSSGGAAGGELEVLLAHPGGPFWARKDEGAWSVPKGEYGPDEDPWAAAAREFAEELGLPVPRGERLDLGEVKQAGGKVVTVFAVHADLDITEARSNTFALEWPRGSGRMREFPEVDRVAWLPVETARAKLLKGQRPFLDRLRTHLAER